MGGADGGLSYAANTRKFYFYRGIYSFAFGTFGLILVLFMLAKPMTLAQFMVLMGILNVTITLFEIHTGVVANKVSGSST